MDTCIETIVEEYRSRKIDRRVFFERLIAVVGSYPVAYLLLEKNGLALSLLSPIESENANVESTAVTYPGEGVTLQGYLSHPKGNGPFPAVILVHHGFGLDDHSRDVTRRLASEGFLTLGVDLLSRKGGTASMPSPEEAMKALGTLADREIISDLSAAYNYLTSHPMVKKDRIGILGFCSGGSQAFLYATENPNLKAMVIFYGSAPKSEAALAKIQCPVLGNYGELDERTTATVPATAAAMQRLGKSFDYKIYPNAPHAFFHEVRPERYNEAAAKDAWERTIQFYRKNLG